MGGVTKFVNVLYCPLLHYRYDGGQKGGFRKQKRSNNSTFTSLPVNMYLYVFWVRPGDRRKASRGPKEDNANVECCSIG